MAYCSEAAKVRDLPNVMKYITGRIADVGAGADKITPDAIAFDGRSLEGVDVAGEDCLLDGRWFDTIFSSHFLEHIVDPSTYFYDWLDHLETGGHVVLYLPQKGAYDSWQNEEHMWNWDHQDFVFWVRRSFCGEGKNYKGEYLPKMFELVDHALDLGEDRYSFYVILKKV